MNTTEQATTGRTDWQAHAYPVRRGDSSYTANAVLIDQNQRRVSMSTTPEFEGANEQGMNNPQGEHTQGSSQSEQTSAERAAEKAREGATAAASALRRGEFMHDAAVDPAADRDDKLIAMLAYVTQILIPFIMPVIILLSESSKKRPFQRYHAVQSLALTVVVTAFAAALAIGTAL